MNPLFIPALLFSIFLFMTPAAKASPEDATGFIDSLSARVVTIVADKDISPEEKETTLEAMFKESVDVAWIGKFVLGKYWRTASEDQRARYQQFYDPFLIRSYTTRFREYSGEKSEALGAKETKEGEYIVNTRIIRPGAAPILVDYRVRKVADTSGKKSKNPTYRVFDVIVEGVSLLATQRSEFSTVVARDGMDSLIKKLEARASQFEKGVPSSSAAAPGLLTSASAQ